MKKKIIDYVDQFKFGGMNIKELELLYDICHNKIVLELGTEVGQSAYVMASVANKVICVDVWNDSYEHLNHDIIQKNEYLSGLNSKLTHGNSISMSDTQTEFNIFNKFKENCKEFIKSGKIEFFKGKTSDVVDKFINESFDIILIDADHSYEGVIIDIYLYLSKLKKDGFLIFHDYGCWKWTGVKKACDYAEQDGKLKLVSSIDRIAIFNKL